MLQNEHFVKAFLFGIAAAVSDECVQFCADVAADDELSKRIEAISKELIELILFEANKRPDPEGMKLQVARALRSDGKFGGVYRFVSLDDTERINDAAEIRAESPGNQGGL